MAKSQKKRERRRHNPMRVPDTHLPPGVAAAAQTSTRAESILPIMQKLEGEDGRDRVWACAAVSNVIQNDPSTRRLLQSKNVVGVLINKLSDPSSEVVSEAAGALRNLCVDGGFDICAEMYNKGILTPLQTSISQIADAMDHYLDPQGSLSQPVRRMIAEFAENVLTILACLSEASHKALAAINNISPVPFLMSFIQNCQKLPLAPVAAAAHCLYILSDENEPISNTLRASSDSINAIIRGIRYVPAEKQRDDGVISNMNIDTVSSLEFNLLGIDDQRLIGFRLWSCGILNNISPLPVVMPISGMDLTEKLLLPELLPVLSVSLPEVASFISSVVSTEPQSTPRKTDSPKKFQTDHMTEQERALQSVEQRLSNIQFALEILTAIAATLPSPSTDIGPDIENEDDDSDGETLPPRVFTNGDEVKASPESLLSLTKLLPALSGPLLHLAHPTDISFPPPEKPALYPAITHGIALVHIRALECLNNLFLSLGLNAESIPLSSSDIESAASIWQDLLTILADVGFHNSPGQEQRYEIWTSAIGALWGVARVCKTQLLASDSQIAMLLSFYGHAKDDDVKVKCIGALECLAQTPNAVQQNKSVAEFLFDLLQDPAPNHPEPYIQAISALIDIYSDEEMPYDINFRLSGGLQRLKNIQGSLKNIVHAISRGTPGERELRTYGEEVLLNLRGFIHYREHLV